jgi:hypothetical protein
MPTTTTDVPSSTDLYTMVFKKNGNEVTEANGGDIIDVELFSTDPDLIKKNDPQLLEISNFQWDILSSTSDDLDFSNCNYVNGSLTNSRGEVPLPDDEKTLNGFMKTYKTISGTRTSLTDKIKFKIKLADANNFSNKTAQITTLTNIGFKINDVSNSSKSFNLTIRPKYNKWVVVGALLAIATASSNQENNN